MAVLFEFQSGNHCSVGRGCMQLAIHSLVLYFTKTGQNKSRVPLPTSRTVQGGVRQW